MNRLKKTLAALVVLILVVMIALPQLLSTTYVKKRVANQLSALTGRPVTIQGESSLFLRPYLSVSYDNVNIEDPTSKNDTPLVAIESLRARLNPLSALAGNIKLAEVTLIRPQFNLRREADGRKNWHSKNGEFADRLSTPSDQQPKALSLGQIDIIDGIVTFDDVKKRKAEELTGINGQLIWQELLGAASLDLTAVWRGENFTGSASLSNPFEILRGGETTLDLSLNSNPLSGTYTGNYNSAEHTAIGELSATSPSFARLSEWLDCPLAATEYIGPGAISGKVSLSGNALEFPDSQVTIGNHSGTGHLRFFLDEKKVPSVHGTLAFDTLNLEDAAALPWQHLSRSGDTLDLSHLQGFHLDLRLSANEVSTTSLEFSNLAASIIVRDANATFDIGQADAMGGSIKASLELAPMQEQASMAANILFDKIDLEELTRITGANAISLKGKGSATLKLKTNTTNTINRLNGQGSVQGKEGTLEGIDLAEILNTARQHPEKVRSSLSGTTPYDNLDLKIHIANGIAFLRGSTITGNGLSIALGGRTDLARGSLALRGKVSEIGDTEDNSGERAVQNNPVQNSGEKSVANTGTVTGKNSDIRSLPFFIGGTAQSPLFVPLIATAAPDSRSTPPPTKDKTPPKTPLPEGNL